MKIVAPAGNKERFFAAIKATADEIYLGLKGFGARRNAENFTLDEIKEALDYAHLRGSRIFLTLNTVMTNREIEMLYPTLKELYNYGLDAIIVQDLGYAKYLHENFPEIEIHGSTQLTVANHYEINYLKTLGFKRVVLPRELSFEEIKSIRENTDMELEVFVSGSLCISFSGNCYLSSFVGGRSGNRGMCAQPCRKEYKDSCGNSSYFLSPKDQLLGFEEIQKLKNIGIESIKIEGRMKDVNYVYETISYYRNLIDGLNVKSNTSKLFNRGYSKGYFYSNKEIINSDYSYNMGEKIGEVTGKYIKLSQDLICGDGITFLSANYKNLGGEFINKLDLVSIQDERKIAYAGEKLSLNFPVGTKYIFRNYNKKINDEVAKEIKNNNKKLKIKAEFEAKIGMTSKLSLYVEKDNFKIVEVEVFSEVKTQKALKKQLEIEEIKGKLSEIGESEFILTDIDVNIENGIFIPLSEIKSLKRNAVEKLQEKILNFYRRDLDKELKEKGKTYYKLTIEKDDEKSMSYIAIVSNDEQYETVNSLKNEYGIEEIYHRTYDVAKQSSLGKHDLSNSLASNLYELLENKNSKVLLNWNMNITNSYTLKVLENIKNLDTVIISPELNFAKIRFLGKTQLKKAILIYSKLKGMTIDIELTEGKKFLTNVEGDKYLVSKNKFGTEIFIEKPLNIINIIEKLKMYCIDKLVLEFTNETKEEVEKVLKQLKTRKGEYREYNYKRGVY
ncbi:MAG: U32 family peptidase [Fusobacterium gastrosuis]|uniref:peptidase U32 family protein n=1 Tax=Fusobacterium gastrosuis TaxID=1755100 RepID=UPI002A937AE4|nr:U32 family peptidase [Fusobacteriaceae bacterium]MDY5795871.1 U32 family peptidase [Fusobacterium gastrosuis]